MGLEDLISPIKWVDEQILTQYTRLAGKIEETNRDTNLVAFGLTFASFCAAGVGTEDPHILGDRLLMSVEQNPLLSVLFIPAAAYAGLALHDMFYSGYKLFHKNQESIGEIAIDKFDYLSRKVQRAARLPFLGFGTCALFEFGMSVYESGMAVSENDIPALILGIAFASLASSMYLKDSDPKLLQKRPFWESAYNWLKEKTTLMIPSPQPVPVYSPL